MEMKRFTKWLAAAMTAAALLTCAPAGIGGGMTATAATAAKTALNKKSVVLDVKQTQKITLKNASGTIVWKSGNTAVAKVKGSGKNAVITAGSKAGKTTVTATVGGKSYKCSVNVYKFALSSKKLNLKSGKKATLTLKNASKASITWKSSKPEIVEILKINKNKVRLQAGAKAGTSKVTAKVGKKTYTCSVKVKLNSVAGSWSGKQFIKSNGTALSGGAYPIGNSYYVFDDNGYRTGQGWHSINGYWYYSDSEGKTAAGSWAEVPDNTQDAYWTNYTYYHDKKYFDSEGRWDMRKSSKVVWDTVYDVVTLPRESCNEHQQPQGVYVLEPKKGKTGYYQWIMNNSVKHDDNRPIYAVKKKVYVAFGAPYSIQLKDIELSVAKDGDPMISKVINRVSHPIGYIGNQVIMYP